MDEGFALVTTSSQLASLQQPRVTRQGWSVWCRAGDLQKEVRMSAGRTDTYDVKMHVREKCMWKKYVGISCLFAQCIDVKILK